MVSKDCENFGRVIEMADWELQLSLVRMSEVEYTVGKYYWLAVLTPV